MVFSAPAERDDGRGPVQEGACTHPAGETVAFRVNDEQGGSGRGVRVFAGARWDPFIMDAPAALKTIATGKLAFTDPRDRSTWTARTSSASSSRSTAPDAWQHGAGRRGCGDPDAGQAHRAAGTGGRPEVKNMMLAPKQFDPVNRDLEIRDLYNMEDAFHLGRGLSWGVPGPAERQPGLLGQPRRAGRLAPGRGRGVTR